VIGADGAVLVRCGNIGQLEMAAAELGRADFAQARVADARDRSA
jgi:hypothetical protein